MTVKVLLDDSIISVSTVASSRYVAPIKAEVDKLLNQLTLLNQTLVMAVTEFICNRKQVLLPPPNGADHQPVLLCCSSP